MNRFLQLGTLLAGLILLAVLGFVRKEEPTEERRTRRPAEVRGSDPEVAVTPAPPTPAGGSLDGILAAALVERPPGVLSGPFKVEGSGEGPDGLAELALTASQRTIVDALVADRDAKLREIRRAVEVRTPKGADADRLCVEAERAQSSCVASIRSTLFPEQQPTFDRLVKSGRWGGYTLIIPR